MVWTYVPGSATPGGFALLELPSLIRINAGSFVATGAPGLSGTAPVRHGVTENDSDHGGFVDTSTHPPRLFVVEGFIDVPDIEDVWAAADYLVDAFSLARGVQTLHVNRLGWAEARQIDVLLDAAGISFYEPGKGSEQRMPIRDFDVPLIAADPRLYGITERSESLPASVGGTPVAVDNDGNFDAPIVVRFNGPYTGPARLIDDDTGFEIHVTGDVGAGDWVEVDVRAQTVVTDTGDSYEQRLYVDTLTGIKAGGTTLRATVTATSGAPTVDVTWRDTWANG